MNIAFLSAIEESKIVTNGLIAYWDAGHPQSYPRIGNTWKDISSNNRAGSLSNATYNSNDQGYFVFTGTSSYANAGNIFNFERTNAFSLGTWINITSYTQSPMIIAKQLNAGNFTGYYMAVTNVSDLSIYLRAAPTNYIGLTSSVSLPQNEWCYVAMTFTGNSNASGVTAYLNGSEINMDVISNNLINNISNAANFSIGSRNLTGNYFKGNISVVQVYNRTLSPEDILQNYNVEKYRYQ